MELKAPREICGIVFWHGEFIGVWDEDGELLKFEPEAGSGEIWATVGVVIDVLEHAVRLNKIEIQTFKQLRLKLLCLYWMNCNPLDFENEPSTHVFIDEIFEIVDSYWYRITKK